MSITSEEDLEEWAEKITKLEADITAIEASLSNIESDKEQILKRYLEPSETPERMSMKYIAVLEGEGENFGMFVPDILGAVGAGVTAEEALESLKESLALQLADLTESGISWPKPTPAEQLDLSEFEPEEPYRFVEVAATTEFERQRD